MLKRLATTMSAVASGLLVVLVTAVSPAAAAPPQVVEIPVSFAVKNTNNTQVVCHSDGKDYTVRGRIVTPRSAPADPTAATLYLHAVTWGEYYWNFTGVPNYAFATQLAERGHTSVIVDRLGYGASDKPPGNDTCFGSEADVAHQMVQALRNGTYDLGPSQAEWDEPVEFSTVNVGGASVGGLISHIVAYTFSDVDAVINMAWGDLTVTPFAAQEFADVLSRCVQGGDEGAPPDYAAFFKNSREKFYFNSATSDVRAAVPALNPDPCGQLSSIPAGVAADVLLLGQITVPVQVIFGDADAVFGPQPLAADQQAARYTGSPQVTTTIIPDASHYPLVEANHLQVVDGVDAFLNQSQSSYQE
ncbi:MAG: alpha/beta hydrolase [Pseudonocardiaceae bacterium]